jgi:hypothetical protein
LTDAPTKSVLFFVLVNITRQTKCKQYLRNLAWLEHKVFLKHHTTLADTKSDQ